LVFALKFGRKEQILIVAAGLWMLAAFSAPAAAPGQTQVLSGHVPKVTRHLAVQGRLNANANLQVAIGLPFRNSEQLTNLLRDIYNPSSPNFRHFLKPEQFTAAFAPTVEDYQSVIDFAKAHNLTIIHTHANRTLVNLSGSVKDIENAFHVHLQTFQHPKENRTFFAPDVEPSLDLKTSVLAISGLDNYVRPRPHLHANIRINKGPGGGSGGGNTGPFAGGDYEAAYVPNTLEDGTGQTIGLFELFPFNEQDIEDYEDDYGFPSYVTVTPVAIDGADTNSADYNYFDPNTLAQTPYLDYVIEVTGDIETTISMAPGCSVLVYEGPVPQDEPPLGTNYIQDATTTAQINDVLNRMATDDQANQLSCSYGFDINLSTVQIFQQFAAQGQSFFLAAGDFGAFSGPIDEPADDPYITVVGGTQATLNKTNSTWISESTWITPAHIDPSTDEAVPYEAGAGGISTAYAIPSWQQGISMSANQGSTTMRNIPDVSAIAYNLTVVWGNDFYDSLGIGPGSDPYPVNGTSLTAPLWAGLFALANEQAADNGQPPVGFANPVLYAIAKSTNYQACFHDITTGMNTNSSSPTKYYATPGYDLCTGLGSPNGDNLIPALLSPPVDNLQITSPLGFTTFGPGGGPYTVTNETYTLSNLGGSFLSWSLVNTSAWLTASSTSGGLKVGASTTVTISLSSAANNFLIYHASGNVVFKNLSAGTTQNRQFDLYAGNGGFETGGLDDWTMVGSTGDNFALAADDADVAGEPALSSDEPDGLFVNSGLYGAYLGETAEDGPAVGSLSQSLATAPGQRYLVSLWLNSLPGDDGVATNNLFRVKWNNSALFAQTNMSANGWTNLQFVVPAVFAHTPFEFDFNNEPGAFGLDDVAVQPVPGPVLNATVVSKGNLAISWNAILNVSYQIQSSTNLGVSGWSNVGSQILATNTVMSVSLPMGNAPGQFYKVIIP
jgi:subtilase family serine protease